MKKIITCQTIDGKGIDVPLSEMSFRPSVYGIAIRDNKEVLLVPQWDGYDIPGGGVDLGELMPDALVREVKEETGLDCKPLEILHATDSFFYHPNRKQAFQTPLIYFLIEITGGEISTDGFDTHEQDYAGEAEWVPIEKLPELKFYNPINSPALVAKAQKILATLHG